MQTNKFSILDNLPQACALVLASASCLCATPGQADEVDASADYYFQEFPVVLTASRLSQPLSEAPSAMTVIDREMIRASGFRSVPELMQLVPGMYVGFADANRPVVSFHGATDEYSRRMQILIDGRSVYLPPFGGVNWADLPLQVGDIERIEVVRGPSAASHGINSFYGVINIITRDALSQVGGSVSVTGGDASDYSARFGRAGEQFDYRISVGRRSDRGIDNAILGDHNATRLFNFRSNYRPNATDSLDVQLGSSDGVYGLGVAGRPEDAFRETTSKSNFLQASWLHVWPASVESRLTFSYTDRSALDPYLCFDSAVCQGNVPGTPRADGFTRQDVYSQRNELELQNTHQLGDSNRLVWGARTRSDHAHYPLFLGRPYTVNSWQVFAHDEWRFIPSAVLNVGTMFEDNGMGNRNSSPRASLNYHFTPQHTLRVGISTATRSPAMGEVYMDAQNTVLGGAYVTPVTPLKPEKIVSKEVGYLGEFRSLGITFDARVYLDQVTDMIFWDKFAAQTAADSLKNMLSAEYKGVEATLKYHWNERRSFLSANFAHQQASISFSNYPTQYFSTDPDPYGPFITIGERVRSAYMEEDWPGRLSQIVSTNSASLLLSHQFADNWQFSTGYYWRMPVRVANVSPDVVGENTLRRLDLRIAKSFRLDQGRSAELALVVQNAAQNNYTKYGVINEIANIAFTRRGWLSATLNF